MDTTTDTTPQAETNTTTLVPPTGTEQTTATPDSTQNTTNPFDFSNISDPTETGAPETEPNPDTPDTPDSTYTITFGESFDGSDDVRNMITNKARENGLPAEAASAFINGVLDELNEARIAKAESDYQNLKKTWGASFERKMDANRRFLGNLLKQGAISQEDAAELMTPAAFRLTEAIRSQLGEKRTVGTKAAAPINKKAELNDILNNKDNPYYLKLLNPRDPGYAEAAAHVNKLAGFKLY